VGNEREEDVLIAAASSSSLLANVECEEINKKILRFGRCGRGRN
jgi:hypothetical protein